MNPQPKSSQEEKSDYWQQHIKAWNRSGLSQKHYCRSRALALSTFCYWKKRLKGHEPAPAKFYPLTIPASLPEQNDTGLMLIIGPKKILVKIEQDFSPAVLKKLIATLEQV